MNYISICQPNKIQLSDTDIINLSNSGTGSIAQLTMIAEFNDLINPKQIF